MKFPRLPGVSFLKEPSGGRGVIHLASKTASKTQRIDAAGQFTGEGHSIYLMSPYKFLALAAPLSINGGYVTSNKKEEERQIAKNRKHIEKLAGDIDKEGLQELPQLTYDPYTGSIIGHEGRHRAHAAIALGKRLIPVEVHDTWRYHHPHFVLDTKHVEKEWKRERGKDNIRDINEEEEKTKKMEFARNREKYLKASITKAENKEFKDWYGVYSGFSYGPSVEDLKKIQQKVDEDYWANHQKRELQRQRENIKIGGFPYEVEKKYDEYENARAKEIVDASKGKMPGAIRKWESVDYPQTAYHVSASPKIELREGHNIKAGREMYGPRKGFYVSKDPAAWIDILGKERTTNKERKTYIYPVDISGLKKEEVEDTTGAGWKSLNEELARRKGKELGLDEETINRVATPAQEQKIAPSALKKITLGKPIEVSRDWGKYWEGRNEPGWETWQFGGDVKREIEAAQLAKNKLGEKGTPLYPTELPAKKSITINTWKEAYKENRIQDAEKSKKQKQSNLIPKSGGYLPETQYRVDTNTVNIAAPAIEHGVEFEQTDTGIKAKNITSPNQFVTNEARFKMNVMNIPHEYEIDRDVEDVSKFKDGEAFVKPEFPIKEDYIWGGLVPLYPKEDEKGNLKSLKESDPVLYKDKMQDRKELLDSDYDLRDKGILLATEQAKKRKLQSEESSEYAGSSEEQEAELESLYGDDNDG